MALQKPRNISHLSGSRGWRRRSDVQGTQQVSDRWCSERETSDPAEPEG